MSIEEKLVGEVIMVVVVVGNVANRLSVKNMNGYIRYVVWCWWCLVDKEGYGGWKTLGIIGVCWGCRGEWRVKVWLEDVCFEVHCGWSGGVDWTG